MKVYVGFSNPIEFSLFASLIRFIENKPYDHAYIRLQEPMYNEYLIFQSSSLEVNLYNKEIFKQNHLSLKEYEIEITENQYKLLWQFVKNTLGTPYSLKEDFGILEMKILGLSKQPFQDGNSKEFCSKLAATVCILLGIEMPTDCGSIDPSLLDSILTNKKITEINNPKF